MDAPAEPGTCKDCGAALRLLGSIRCPRCGMAHARGTRGPSRRKTPDRFAVEVEAARLPEVLLGFLEDSQP